MRGLIALVVLALALASASAARAETVEELKQQLAAEKAKNSELQRRIDALEAAQSVQPAVMRTAGESDAPNASAEPDAEDEGDAESRRALERALVARGRAVLRPFAFELTPSLAWEHDGSNAAQDSMDAYAGAVSLGMGLPWEMQVTVGVPYFFHAETPWGENHGIGDASVALSKQLTAQSERWPSVVATVGWSVPTGQDQFETNVPLGSGFHTLKGTLSFVKSIDPLAYYGDISYRSPQSWDSAMAQYEPGDSIAIRGGSTLAVTPDISLSASVNFAFVDEYKLNGATVQGSGRTVGTAELSTGIVLSRSTFLQISGQFGITDDAPDAAMNVSVPIRF